MALRLAALLLLTACASSADLPTQGRVWLDDGTALTPAADVLVLARRVNVCDKFVLASASTTGIDAHVVRTDAEGRYTVPARRFDDVCSRAILYAVAWRPGHASLSGRVVRQVSGPDSARRAAVAADEDAVLYPVAPDSARAAELAGQLYSEFSSYTIDGDMRRQVLDAMRPEFGELAPYWAAACSRWGVCE